MLKTNSAITQTLQCFRPLSICLIIFYFLFLNACAHSLHEYEAQSVNQNNSGKIITSLGEQSTVMGFVQDTNYVNEAFDRLKRQCSQGRIEGINTRYSTSLGFFSWTNKVHMQGYCISQK